MPRESIEIVHGKDQGSPSDFSVGQVLRLTDTNERTRPFADVLAYLEDERFVEDRIQRLSVDFRFELLLLIRQDVDFDVRVRRAAHVHGGQLLSLNDFHFKLNERVNVPGRANERHLPLAFENRSPTSTPICPDWALRSSSSRRLHCPPCSVLILPRRAESERE